MEADTICPECWGTGKWVKGSQECLPLMRKMAAVLGGGSTTSPHH
uniref:Uncharacterized protein n=1 Tax=Anguilla anguilla TaxID=7936 RepID=A0A0E9XUV5_ANGAN